MNSTQLQLNNTYLNSFEDLYDYLKLDTMLIRCSILTKLPVNKEKKGGGRFLQFFQKDLTCYIQTYLNAISQYTVV